MSEWETIGLMAAVGGVVFGAVWLLMKDCERGINGRIKRCEHAIDTVATEMGERHDNYVTTGALDRFERNLNTRFDVIGNSVEHLTTRIDDFIVANRNGKAKA